MNARTSYIVDRVLHWLSVAAILYLLLNMGSSIHNIDYTIKGAIQHKQDAIALHMSIGVVLFCTLVLRLIWYRFFLDKRYWLTYENVKHKWLVRSIHGAFYGVLLLMMISGLVMINHYEHPLSIFNLFEFSQRVENRSLFFTANDWHLTFESLVYWLIALHLAGVIYSKR
ncbi:cytochrome b [Thalassotalea ganghwensis]